MIGVTLRKILEECGTNVNELSHRTGIPAQTLYSVIRRDSMKIDLDVLRRICKELDVPVEMFCGESCPALPDMEEWHLVQRYRRLDSHGRRIVNLVMDEEFERASSMALNA